MNEVIKTDIFDTLNRLNNVIKNSPLIQKISHLVEIDLNVVGGSVRDLYLDKPIKDIDISVSLNFNKNLKIIYPERSFSHYNDDYDTYGDYMADQSAEADALDSRNQEILELLGTSEFSIIHDLLHKEKTPTAIQAVISLIQKVIENNQNYSINQVFDQNTMDISSEPINLREMAYEATGLCAVVAISDKKANYPIELLFTADNVQNFLHFFDFDICKIHMENKNGIPTIVPSTNFLKDVKNKTITYTPTNDLTEAKINKSLLIRYERLHKKFSEYVLTSNALSLTPELKVFVENTVKTVNLYHQIKENSNNNVEKNKVKVTSKI